MQIGELCSSYLEHAAVYYRRPDGTDTGEANNARLALRELRERFECLEADEFGPKALKVVRNDMIEAGLARTTINKRVNAIRRAFRWAVADEMCRAETWHALSAVEPLKPHRSMARETKRVSPVPEEWIEGVRERCGRIIRGMIDLQLASGARPGEVVSLQWQHVQRMPDVWLYAPPHHKTAHHGRVRRVYFGEAAREVLEEFEDGRSEGYVFRPCDAERTSSTRQRYETRAYCKAIHRACRRAGVPLWGPNRLRHTFATRARAEAGMDVTRLLLGHASVSTTEIYARADEQRVIEAMKVLG